MREWWWHDNINVFNFLKFFIHFQLKIMDFFLILEHYAPPNQESSSKKSKYFVIIIHTMHTKVGSLLIRFNCKQIRKSPIFE